jgi:dTDP-4-amino-4,6-dideoxygalactose transaminase
MSFFENLDTKVCSAKDELFFNMGRSALKFFLQNFSEYLNKQLVVVIQSFNCHVVLEAALQTNCKIYLVDICVNDFSVNMEELKKIDEKIDVLLLTHYQGIPNQKYLKIKEFCENNNVFFIDDVSQTEYSFINGVLVGSLSDISLRSFGFDKPFTSFQGGSIDISNLKNTSLKTFLLEKYKKLPNETIEKTNLELKILKFLLIYTKEKTYYPQLENYIFLRFIKTYKIDENLAFSFWKNRYVRRFLKILFKYFSKNNNFIFITKLHPKKINLILKQRGIFKFDNNEVQALESFLCKNNITIEKEENCIINWNRYSILDDENRTIKILLNKENIQFGNYNWPIPLHKLYAGHESIIFKKTYPVSEYVCKYILNIPVWSDYFRRLYVK